MKDSIRDATPADVPAMVELSERKRLEYEAYQPTFWRKAADSREKQTAFFQNVLERNDRLVLVYERNAEVVGFVIAALVPAPPVYDPGGPTCMVDDFAVADPTDWESVGEALLDAAIGEARHNGAVQAVVVCGHRDALKRSMLAANGYGIASEWYVKEI